MAFDEYASDDQLVEKLQKGDTEAFDQIFQKYGGKLFGFALKYLKSKEDTEGLVQDVFLKIWENRRNLKKDASLKAYIFTIAYHNICRIFRKRQMKKTFSLEIFNENEPVLNPEEQLDYKSTLEQVEHLISKLPEKQRIIFMKSRKEGKSTREIANEMNLAPGTIDNQISNTLKYLRKNIFGRSLSLLLFCAIFIQ